MPEDHEYILGTHDTELRRLRFQHHAWTRQMHDIVERAGIRTGHRVVDLGCGPGFTTLELAQTVGASGHVLASDVSARFLAFLRKTCEERGVTHVETVQGPAESLALEPASIDAAYARWLLCWMPRPQDVVTMIARALKPGGALVIQDYLDWGAKKLIPRGPAHERVVAACLHEWDVGVAKIDIGEDLPTFAAAAGLEVEVFEPVARIGRVGSLEWRWLGGFYAEYVPRLVERGFLSQEHADEFESEWRERTDHGSSLVLTPTVVDAVLRKPLA